MIDVRSTLRRAAVILLAVVGATALLRPQLSSALVTRGDDLAYSGNTIRARVMYRRARVFDRENAVAEDRLIFSELMTHERSRVRAAVTEASAYLLRAPSDETIRMDRALGFQMLRDYAAAARDFALVGMTQHDARALTFAGIDAVHAGDRTRAFAWLREALRLEPRDEPASRALRRIAS